MNFLEAFKSLKRAGIKALPMPGTNKYYIFFRDGQSIFIKEKILLKMVQASNNDPGYIVQTLNSLKTPR